MCPCSWVNPDNSYPVATLLPQSRTMVLLDRVVETGADFIMTELTVRDDGLFSNHDHTVPAWIGLEYMAQTIAAFSGYNRKCRGEEIGLGFLLGTRYYKCSVGSFPCGMSLQVRAEKVIETDNEMSVFNCIIEGKNIYASAMLNVLLPKDAKKFLLRKGL